jgi:hypothetical protein
LKRKNNTFKKLTTTEFRQPLTWNDAIKS